jgi:hypothetical protein
MASENLPNGPQDTSSVELNSMQPSKPTSKPLSKPIVWHLYGADINIRVVDGVPYVNDEKVEPVRPSLTGGK